MAKPVMKEPQLDPVTVAELLRMLEARINDVEVYGAGGCPTCKDGEARGFAFRLRRLLVAHVDKGAGSS